mmetsp:Transcript_21352/g.45454  ORF Transcript_21352/g.45454 Transcript_21352/m.45454 type:complete len:238 (-) Transcript_21352:27-740(-)
MRRQRCSPTYAIAIFTLMAWALLRDSELRAWSAGGVTRRGALQIVVASSVIGTGKSETRAAVALAGGPAALSPRQCVAPYEGGGCALSLQVPTAWQRDAITNPMRLAQWKLDPADSTNVVIFYLPLGGGIEDQLGRWEAEFPPNSRSSGPRRSGVFDVNKQTPVVLEVAGSWAGGGPAGAKKEGLLKAGYAMCGAIVPGAVQGERPMAFFVKAVGPQAVVRANAELFRQFVTSMQTS